MDPDFRLLSSSEGPQSHAAEDCGFWEQPRSLDRCQARLQLAVKVPAPPVCRDIECDNRGPWRSLAAFE